jgi:hypothetical protein
MKEFEDLEEDINNLGEYCYQPHLTREDYETFLKTKHWSSEDRNTNNTEDTSCQGITDTIMVELQNKYNIRSKTKNMTTTQPKKIFSRGEVYEPTPKESETQNTRINGVDPQGAKTKIDKTHTQEQKKLKTKQYKQIKRRRRRLKYQSEKPKKL